MIKRIASALSSAAASGASLLKVAILSRRPAPSTRRAPGSAIAILGNGPSLADTIATKAEWLRTLPLMAVNFAARTPEWQMLRPEFYVLVDPHFFEGRDSDPNVADLWKHLAEASWPITLYVPAPRVGMARRLAASPHITIKALNLTPIEGLRPVSLLLMRLGLGMPRPRNVLIPALMAALREGFDTIFVAGADHTWTRTLSVDDQNRVCTIQPHFYADNAAEQQRVATFYSDIHLHQMLESLTIAFRSYFKIADYAQSRGCRIFNITPGSFIDAFPRLASPETLPPVAVD